MQICILTNVDGMYMKPDKFHSHCSINFNEVRLETTQMSVSGAKTGTLTHQKIRCKNEERCLYMKLEGFPKRVKKKDGPKC